MIVIYKNIREIFAVNFVFLLMCSKAKGEAEQIARLIRDSWV